MFVSTVKCPVELARYLSAFEERLETLKVGNKASDLRRETGADDETARRDSERVLALN
jgi:hypothetical protein